MRGEAEHRWAALGAGVTRNRSIEEAIHDQQESELRRLRESFMPDQPSAEYMQAVAFRGKRPIAELREEARDAEGGQRLSDFGRWWDMADDETRQSLRGLATGLIKEDMPASLFQRIVDSTRREDDSIYDYDEDLRERADRVLQGMFATVSGLHERLQEPVRIPTHTPAGSKFGSVRRGLGNLVGGAADLAAVPRLVAGPFKALAEAPVEVGRELLTGDPAGARRELGESVAPIREPIEAAIEIAREGIRGNLQGVVRELREARQEVPQAADIDRAWRGVNRIFEGEQQIVTPFTRPLIHNTLTVFGVPEKNASSIAKYAAEVIVPTTFATGGAGLLGRGRSASRILLPLLSEGVINVLQNRAGHRARGEPDPSRSEDIMMMAGGVGGRGGGELLGAVGGKAIRGLLGSEAGQRAVQRAGEAILGGEEGALRIFEAPRSPVDVQQGRHRLLTEAGDKLDWRETPEGGKIEDVTAIVERQGTGTALLERAIDDIRAKNPDAIITADLNSEGGARLFARAALKRRGAAFTDVRGRQLTSGEAVDAAARREGPQVTMPARVADDAAASVAPLGERIDLLLQPRPSQVKPELWDQIVQERRGGAPAVGARTGAEPAAIPAAPAAEAPLPRVVKPTPNRPAALKKAPDKPIGRFLHFDRDRNGWWVARKSSKSGKTRRVFYPRGAVVGLEEAPAPSAVPPLGAAAPAPEAAIPPPRPSYSVHAVRQAKMQGDATEKLQHLVRTSTRLKGESGALIQEKLLQQTASAAQAAERAAAEPGRAPGRVAAAARSAMKGKRKMPIIGVRDAQGELTIPRAAFNDTEVLALEDALRAAYPTRVHDSTNALDALDSLLNGYTLAPHQLALLKPILPKDALAAITERMGFWKRAVHEAVPLINIQRLFQSGVGDISWMLRQAGGVIAFPRQWAQGSVVGIRALFSGRYSDDIAKYISSQPDYDSLLERGLDLGGIEEQLGRGEAVMEERAGQIAKTWLGDFLTEKVPVVRQTARSFRMGMAAIRYHLGSEWYANMRKLGKTTDEIDGAMNLANRLTGRGTLGPAERYAPILNQVLYSARLQASLVQSPFYIFHKSAYVRKLAARGLLGYAGTAVGVLALAKAAGADIELDPRSADWGKVQVAGTRQDILRGWGSLIRTAVRVGTEAAGGQSIKTDIGTFKDAGIRDILQGILESKLAPGAALAADAWAGENFEGRKLHRDWATLKHEVANRFTPFFADAMEEAIKESGWPVASMAFGELVGLGTTSYTPSVTKINNMLNEDIERGDLDLDDYPELEGRAPRIRSELHPKDRQEFDKRHADELREIEKHYGTEIETPEAAAYEASREIEAESLDKLKGVARDVASGDMTKGEAREAISELQTNRRYQKDVVQRILEAQGVDARDDPQRPGTLVQDLYDYGQVFDRYPDSDTNPDEREALMEALDAFRSELGPEREGRLDENLNLGFKTVPIFRELQAVKKRLTDTGYFDRIDTAWADIQAHFADQGFDVPDDPEVLRDQMVRAVIQGGLDPHTAEDLVDESDIFKLWRRHQKQVSQLYATEYPDELIDAVRWGYKDELNDFEAEVLLRMGYDLYDIPTSRGSERLVPEP